LKRKIKELNLRTIPEITNAVKAGGACMSCHHVPGGLQDLLDEVWGVSKKQLRILPQTTMPQPVETAMPTGGDGEPLSPYQFNKKVEKALDEYVRPMLRKDGGDVEIVDIKGTLIYCRFQGACAGCAGAAQTMTLMIERPLKDMVDERIRVIRV
jgi:NifU-like protein